MADDKSLRPGHAEGASRRRGPRPLDHRRPGCDGDSVSITAATQPSIEDVLLGAIPGLPQGPPAQPGARLRERRRLPEVLVPGRGRASSIRSCSSSRARSPTRRSRAKATGRRSAPTPTTGQPITTNEWIDRLAPEGAGRRGHRHLRDLRRHPRDGGQSRPAAWAWPTTSAGTGSRRPASRSSTCPAVRCSPTTSWRRCSTCCTRSPGLAPMIPLDEQLRPTWLFGKTVHEGCDRAGYYEQGDFATEYGSPKCIVKLGCWGPVVNCNVPQARLDGRHRRLPQRRRHLHRLHHAGLPRQVHAVHGRAARRAALDRQRQRLRHGRSRALRSFTNATLNKEPKWRHPRPELTTGYHPRPI